MTQPELPQLQEKPYFWISAAFCASSSVANGLVVEVVAAAFDVEADVVVAAAVVVLVVVLLGAVGSPFEYATATAATNAVPRTQPTASPTLSLTPSLFEEEVESGAEVESEVGAGFS